MCVHFCLDVCTKLSDPANGEVHYNEWNMAQVHCDDGYNVDGKDEVELKCVNGTWNPLPPNCSSD